MTPPGSRRRRGQVTRIISMPRSRRSSSRMRSRSKATRVPCVSKTSSSTANRSRSQYGERLAQSSGARMVRVTPPHVFDRGQVEQLQLFQALEYSFEAGWGERPRQVERGPGDRGDRDPIDLREVSAIQIAEVNPELSPCPTCSRRGDLNGFRLEPEQIPEVSGREMAGNCWPRRKDRCHAASIPRKWLMPNRVNTTVNSPQPPHLRRLGRRARRIPQGIELPRRNHAMLPRRQLE